MLPLRVVLLTLLFPLASLGEDLAPDEAAVWQQEQRYWQYVKVRDIEGFLTLWNDRFVGWPVFAGHPLEKSSLAAGLLQLHADPERLYDYRLQREAVRGFGDSVVVHYFYWDMWRDARTGAIVEEQGPFRITHTWQRYGETWQIITGMSASYDQ